jgi:hypothetical protein
MPAPIKPMLGDLELSLVQRIETIEEQVLVDHAVPGLAGSLIQRLNRNPTQVRLHGVITSDEAKEGLEKLREKFHAAEPLLFAADIMAATEVQQVLIADLEVEELAGKPDRFEYWLTLKEYIPPPPDEAAAMQAVDQAVAQGATARQVEQTQQLADGTATLEVSVDQTLRETVQSVVVTGQTEQGEEIRRELTAPEGNLYVFRDLPLGEYVVTAQRREA